MQRNKNGHSKFFLTQQNSFNSCRLYRKAMFLLNKMSSGILYYKGKDMRQASRKA